MTVVKKNSSRRDSLNWKIPNSNRFIFDVIRVSSRFRSLSISTYYYRKKRAWNVIAWKHMFESTPSKMINCVTPTTRQSQLLITIYYYLESVAENFLSIMRIVFIEGRASVNVDYAIAFI